MTGWHAPDHFVTRYADGTLPESDAWSLEKHLESCGSCAARVSRAVRETAAGPVLAEVREALLGPAAARHTATTSPASASSAPATAPGRAPAHGPASAPTSAHGPAPAPTRAHGPALASAPTPEPTPAPTPAHGPLPAPTPTPEPATAPTTTPDPARVPAPAHAPARHTGRSRLWASRWLARGVGPARVLWAAGPAVRGAWLPAVLLVAVGAVALAHGGGVPDARPWLLALAPVVPVAGVALSYGPHADPLHEIAAATPSAGLRLVLTRTAAVLAVSLPLLTIAGALVPSPDAPGAAAWLLPGLALTLAALALAGYVGVRTATALTGAGWLCAALGPVLAAPGGRLTAHLTERLSSYLDGAPAQGGWAAAAVLCAAVLAARRPAYDLLEKR